MTHDESGPGGWLIRDEAAQEYVVEAVHNGRSNRRDDARRDGGPPGRSGDTGALRDI